MFKIFTVILYLKNNFHYVNHLIDCLQITGKLDLDRELKNLIESEDSGSSHTVQGHGGRVHVKSKYTSGEESSSDHEVSVTQKLY